MYENVPTLSEILSKTKLNLKKRHQAADGVV